MMKTIHFMTRRFLTNRACRYLAGVIPAILILAGSSATLPGSTFAGDDALRWTPYDIPAKGEHGGWALADGSDVKYLALADDGAMYVSVSGLTYTLYRSTDGGLGWSHIGNIKDTITGIALPPGDSGTLYYATQSLVYRSTDGGKTIVQLPPLPAGSGDDHVEITSIDVTRTGVNIIAVSARDADHGEFGGVYTIEDNTISSWVDTGIGDFDVNAVAFSPGYFRDSRLLAVMTDEANTFTSFKTGTGDWRSTALDGNNSAEPTPVIAAAAAIAVPDNYSPDSFSESGYYIGVDTGTGDGDVYKIDTIAPDTIIPIDLNIGQEFGQHDIDISGLAVYGSGKDLILLAGAADSADTFTSTDGGETWLTSQKDPTGESSAIVQIPSNYGSSGIMYAATAGDNSAISLSRDAGITWNQVAFIDTTIDNIVDMAPSPDYNRDKTVFLLTFEPSGNSLWRTRDGGRSWERVMSGCPDTDTMTLVRLPHEYGDTSRIIFLAGESSGSPAIWESTDNGQSYCSRSTCDPDTGLPFAIDAWAVAGVSRFFIASFDGSRSLVYRTDNSGFFYNRGTPVGEAQILSMALSPSYQSDQTILAGDCNGNVFLSSDDGQSFQSLPPDAASPPFSDLSMIAFDPLFETNHVVYAAGNTDGVYRFSVGNSRRWENIGATLPVNAYIWRLFTGDKCALYTSDIQGRGAIERCLNPASSSPVFEKLTPGLNEDTLLSNLWTSGSRLWALDSAALTLLTLYDSLTAPVTATAPENGASGIGSLTGHTVKNILLDWEPLEGATAYDWQCNNDTDFSSIPENLQGNTSTSYARLPSLEPATVYYWRVRASSPVLGPWSEKQSFTTCLDTEAIILQPESPASGASDVPVNPVFKWTAIVGATAYELIAATDTDFNSPSIIRTGDSALPANTWRSDVTLENGVTYYWKVRATGAGSHSPWSSVGVFTVEPAAIEAADKIDPEEKEKTQIITPPVETVLQTPTITLSIALLPSTTSLEPAQPTLPTPVSAQNPISGTSWIPGLPDWIVGGLLVIVILALLILLAMVLKMRHIM